MPPPGARGGSLGEVRRSLARVRAWGLQPGPQRPPALGYQQGRPTLGGMSLARWELAPVLELLGIAGPGEPVALGRELGPGGSGLAAAGG